MKQIFAIAMLTSISSMYLTELQAATKTPPPIAPKPSNVAKAQKKIRAVNQPTSAFSDLMDQLVAKPNINAPNMVTVGISLVDRDKLAALVKQAGPMTADLKTLIDQVNNATGAIRQLNSRFKGNFPNGVFNPPDNLVEDDLSFLTALKNRVNGWKKLVENLPTQPAAEQQIVNRVSTLLIEIVNQVNRMIVALNQKVAGINSGAIQVGDQVPRAAGTAAATPANLPPSIAAASAQQGTGKLDALFNTMLSNNTDLIFTGFTNSQRDQIVTEINKTLPRTPNRDSLINQLNNLAQVIQQLHSTLIHEYKGTTFTPTTNNAQTIWSQLTKLDDRLKGHLNSLTSLPNPTPIEYEVQEHIGQNMAFVAQHLEAIIKQYEILLKSSPAKAIQPSSKTSAAAGRPTSSSTSPLTIIERGIPNQPQLEAKIQKMLKEWKISLIPSTRKKMEAARKTGQDAYNILKDLVTKMQQQFGQLVKNEQVTLPRNSINIKQQILLLTNALKQVKNEESILAQSEKVGLGEGSLKNIVLEEKQDYMLLQQAVQLMLNEFQKVGVAH